MKSKYVSRTGKAIQAKDKWIRTKHRLTVHPRELAKEILADISSAGVVRYYEEMGYGPNEEESVLETITRTIQHYVIYGEHEEEE